MVGKLTFSQKQQREGGKRDKEQGTYLVIPNYEFTQLLTGYGCLRAYLHKYNYIDTPLCLKYDENSEKLA